ncbi:MAG TPA: Vms1/Ankzf1 family peptidyl-tRNA hydrolase [Pyrinomonadaceae bacterium]|nr:Vms1/Ankzf1 family peptidyl-tRNA hydrolase [Pyrinomonadaceae bacterium]
MHEFNFLQSLFDHSPGDGPFLSIYLNADANETGKKDFPKFLKKEFADHIAVTEINSDKRKSLDSDESLVFSFIDELDPAVKGAAIFACSAEGFFKTFEFSVAFPKNEFFMFDRPRIFPLAEIVDANPRYAVALADTNSARIYVVNRGEVVRNKEIQNTKTNWIETGGWSQMRFQRHIENFHQQHAKELAAELAKLVRDDRTERIILGGDEAVIIPMLREQLADEVNQRVIAVLPLNVHTVEKDLFAAAEKAVDEHKLGFDKQRTDYILEHRYEAGAGVAGIEDTLKALLNGEVQELYLNPDTADLSYNAKEIEQIFREYGKLNENRPPDLSDSGAMMDELLRFGADTADRVRFVADPHLLKKHGGAGAILRFKAQHART